MEKTYYQKNKKVILKRSNTYYKKHKAEMKQKQIDKKKEIHKALASIKPILYAPAPADVLTVRQKEKIINFIDDRDFIEARYTSSPTKVIWVRIQTHKITWKVKNKTAPRPEETDGIFNAIGLFKCFGLQHKKAKRIIDHQNRMPIPFFETWMELKASVEFYDMYGLYYVEV